MPANVTLHTFNRGRISRLGLARTDLDRVKLSAEVQTNFIPRVLGSMMLRPGLQYIGGIRNNSQNVLIPFVFQASDTALLELTTTALRVWVNDAVVQRSGPISTVVNPGFDSDLSGWTDADETGSTSMWTSAGTSTAGYMALFGTAFTRAIRYQRVTSGAGTQNLSVRVARGPAYFKVGSSQGGDDYFSEKTMRTGHYSLSFHTTGTYFIEFSCNKEYAALVDYCQTESAGDLVVDTPWSSSDLLNVRWTQSNDVLFAACRGISQKRIERYSTYSWAVVDYQADDGPFGVINVTNARLTPDSLTGQVNVYADRSVFSTADVGALYKITSIGQDVKASFTGTDQASNYIRVSGVGTGRTFSVYISSATPTVNILIQRSIGEVGSWQVVPGLGYTSSTLETYTDGLDNQIAFYRLYAPTTNAAGTSKGELIYGGGGITGIVKLQGSIQATAANAIVLSDLGSTSASDLWYQGDWSPTKGYPSAVTMHEGRIFWAGKSRFWGSVSDNFESFDTESTTLGDAGPINITVARGPNDVIQWLTSLTRLLMGTPLQTIQAKTSSLEEPLTPTNFALRDVATRGTAPVQAIKIDQRLLFVHGSETRVMEVAPSISQLDYDCIDRTVLVPEMGEPGIIRSAVQRQPDTRVHFVRSDGTVAMLVSDPAENVLCWIDLTSTGANGRIEDVAVLPGTVEDTVYYSVSREINGSTVRYLEKLAKESEARGGPTNKMADSFIVSQSSVPTTTITGLSHLVGSSVVVWGATDDLGSYTVSGAGSITLSQASTTTIVGLPYGGKYVSAKLAYASPTGGSALTARKKINQVGLVLADTHSLGLQYGQSTTVYQNLPRIEKSERVSTGYVWSAYDSDAVIFPGSWDTDSRLYLLANAPRPVTVLGCIIGIDTREKFT